MVCKNKDNNKIKKVVLAYSGGLDTSVIVHWLIQKYGCEVVCYSGDMGQGEDLSQLDDRAKAAGASKLIVEDLKEDFAKDYIMPAIVVQAEKPVEDAKVNAPTAEEKPIEEPVKEEVPADDEAALEKEFVEEPAVKDETKAEDEEEPKVEANPEDDLLAASGEQNEDEDELLKKYNVTKEDLDKLDTNADFDEDEHSEDDALDDDTESLSDEDEDDGLDSYEQYEKEWD